MMAGEQQNPLVGGARAAVGQGLMMGWGDEAEAWLRSKLGQGEYQDLVKKIRKEYGQYSEQNPITSTLAEFGGGVAPGVAAMFVPGGQPAGAAQIGAAGTSALARLAARPIVRSTAAGVTSGGVAGAGSATEGNRAAGALTGGAEGGAFGLAIPAAMRSSKGVYNWLSERLFPSEQKATTRAAEKMTRAMGESGLTPQQIEQKMAKDRAMGVPSTVANVDPALTDLAEAVAQRTGTGARKIEKTLGEQKLGTRERTYTQVSKGLDPGDYHADEQRLVENLRSKAGPAYEAAYAHGAVDDPVVNAILQHPTFQDAYRRGQKIAESQALAAKLRGEDPSKYLLPELYKPTGKIESLTNTPIMELTAVPNVRTLDYVKRGLDDLIEAGYKGSSSVGKGQSSALKDLRNQFVAAIDRNVPAYRDVRKMYAGDMEVMDAMRAGLNDFSKMDHEQISKLVTGMSEAEKEAFRTGVARDLYGKIMNPSGNFNAAQRIIGSPEMQAKLQPLFESPAHFDLFRNAMEREAQLFGQANKVLGGSQTGKRTQMREALEEGSGAGEAIAGALTGGFWSSLTGIASRAIRSNTMTEEMADKLATMLMSKDPKEVAAVVKLLEGYAVEAAPKAAAATRKELGATTGAAVSALPAPSGGGAAANIEAEGDTSATDKLVNTGPDIEADLGK